MPSNLCRERENTDNKSQISCIALLTLPCTDFIVGARRMVGQGVYLDLAVIVVVALLHYGKKVESIPGILSKKANKNERI